MVYRKSNSAIYQILLVLYFSHMATRMCPFIMLNNSNISSTESVQNSKQSNIKLLLIINL